MNRRSAFTLLELLMVIAVIGILSGLTIGGAKFAFDRSEESSIRTRMKIMEMALEQYRRDWGHYPTLINGLSAAGGGELRFKDFTSPNGTYYMEDETAPAAAANPYRQTRKGVAMHYRYPGVKNTEKYDLWAPGLDEVINTTDDLANWKSE